MHIAGRDVIGSMNSQCVQLRITSTFIPCSDGLSVRLSLSGSSVAISGTLEDARIKHDFNSI